MPKDISISITAIVEHGEYSCDCLCNCSDEESKRACKEFFRIDYEGVINYAERCRWYDQGVCRNPRHLERCLEILQNRLKETVKENKQEIINWNM